MSAPTPLFKSLLLPIESSLNPANELAQLYPIMDTDERKIFVSSFVLSIIGIIVLLIDFILIAYTIYHKKNLVQFGFIYYVIVCLFIITGLGIGLLIGGLYPAKEDDIIEKIQTQIRNTNVPVIGGP